MLINRVFSRLILCLLLAIVQSAFGQHYALTIGTATAGGGFEVYGQALAEVIGQLDPLIDIQLRHTAGSLENIERLKSGSLDMALIQGESAHEALEKYPDDLRIVSAMYPTAGMFVVRADSPYRTIEDLKGQKIAFGARSSGLVTLARYVLDAIGLDMSSDFNAILLDRAGDGPAMLRDGRVAALWGGGLGWPVFIAAMADPVGGRFIAPDHAQIERIRARYPFLKPLTLPANSFFGQTSAIDSVGSWSFIVARKSLDDETVYRFCADLHNGQQLLRNRLVQAQASTMKNTIEAIETLDWLHPGALRFLNDQGFVR